jgi:hypothetical protein
VRLTSARPVSLSGVTSGAASGAGQAAERSADNSHTGSAVDVEEEGGDSDGAAASTLMARNGGGTAARSEECSRGHVSTRVRGFCGVGEREAQRGNATRVSIHRVLPGTPICATQRARTFLSFILLAASIGGIFSFNKKSIGAYFLL